ncbi:MAG: hypothetical protein GC164_07945 [Phycisphaera sp.]|nr:hypothetical protein [Phycisphaera sp.]
MTTDKRPIDLKREYERDGYTIVRSLYTPSEMATWKAALRRAMEDEGFDDPSGVRVWMGRSLPGQVLSAMYEPRVGTILNALIGEDVEYLSAKVVFKSGKTTFGSPWHQDWFYWEGATKLSVWVALDDADESNGCLRLVPGSHTKVLDRQTVRNDRGFSNQVRERDIADQPLVTAAARCGDAIFFHDLLVHGSHPNRTGKDRWSLISTYRSGKTPDPSQVWRHPLLVSGVSVNNAEPI